MNIVLLGYMGCGKTTVGIRLSKLINKKFIDLDQFIELTYNQKIQDIFLTRGEVYFRKIESECLNALMLKYNNAVISLGGGTVCYSNNLELINNSNSFYLKYSIPELSQRLLKINSTRPILSAIDDHDKMIDFVSKHLFERNYYYNQASKVIDCDLKDQDEIASEILTVLS
ncbi:MAG: shikimate kinase [Flavobacteriaceae bacterium]|jgi:shikimate kinase|tara:strand:- start:1527 stop:2039 length:513 start_codon:yes stop_codon:yes gene_type:complete